MKCPACGGTGKISETSLVSKPKRRAMARKLRKAGLPLMVIMKALGYKSPRSVVLACQRND